MKSHSQVSQDLFVLGILGRPEVGQGFQSAKHTYLEIGANLPCHWNNTWLLEQCGWLGISVDCVDYQEEWSKVRHNSFVMADACEFVKTLAVPQQMGYLSLDVEQDTDKVLFALPEGLTFLIVTVEHNLYLPDYCFREEQRKFFGDQGYVLVCGDVCDADKNGSYPFEDWWLHSSIYDPAKHPLMNSCFHRDIIARYGFTHILNHEDANDNYAQSTRAS
jgi:hypothetical protein